VFGFDPDGFDGSCNHPTHDPSLLSDGDEQGKLGDEQSQLFEDRNSHLRNSVIQNQRFFNHEKFI